MDGTFKVLGEPFRQQGQLMFIHAFIERNGAHKQFPLVFCLMSRKTKSDYLAVFRSLQSRLGHISIKGFGLDFEKGKLFINDINVNWEVNIANQQRLTAWITMRKAFPGVELKGCAFHCSQAVCRHFQSVGLAETYMRREDLHSFVRQMLPQQFLPSAHIRQAVKMLQMKATAQATQTLIGNLRRQWLDNPVFPAEVWALHMWLGFYQLVPLLRR
ncbi:hypothetical protein ACJMK2_032201 [Sinanodonta woodiana]|uniref:MULE transposase domain-containing protein n=1 Tax=Sinanodonta woodiana TaxID=1069815 RepID=A0ABD3X4Y1_SINWO